MQPHVEVVWFCLYRIAGNFRGVESVQFAKFIVEKWVWFYNCGTFASELYADTAKAAMLLTSPGGSLTRPMDVPSSSITFS
jgi:hypothetical protein